LIPRRVPAAVHSSARRPPRGFFAGSFSTEAWQMRLHRYRRAALVACSIGLLAAAWPAAAQNFPTRPVRLIIGFPPGGATDLVARIMAPKYSELLGQQVVVDNRTGANGTIGSHLAAQATPDGHTIHLATIGSLVISPAIGKVPYDPIKDFQPISQAV